MSRHFACRWLPTFALALALGGCGALERKPEPTLASAVPKSVAAGASVDAPSAVRPAATSIAASVDHPQGIRPENSRLQLNLNVFGLSYHTDRAGTRDRHLDNELNIGLGLNYEFHNDALGVATLQTGFFKDSGRNWTKIAGAGYQFKFGERWRVGADLLAIHSPTYNNGRGFIAPIPRVTYDFGPVKVNLVYVPRYQDYNRFAVFGLYFSTPLGAW
ncbi:MAG: hypothetical protein NTY05_11035 [Rhodocyclales bacterium]|nr:hypothetical protein [Rhodocyclales bacterium]